MSRVTERLPPGRAGHVGMDALWVKRLTHSQQRLRLMLLVWSVLCKPKAMTGPGVGWGMLPVISHRDPLSTGHPTNAWRRGKVQP